MLKNFSSIQKSYKIFINTICLLLFFEFFYTCKSKGTTEGTQKPQESKVVETVVVESGAQDNDESEESQDSGGELISEKEHREEDYLVHKSEDKEREIQRDEPVYEENQFELDSPITFPETSKKSEIIDLSQPKPLKQPKKKKKIKLNEDCDIIEENGVLRINCGSHNSHIRPHIKVEDNKEKISDNARKVLFFRENEGLFNKIGRKTMKDTHPLLENVKLNLDFERLLNDKSKGQEFITPNIEVIHLYMKDSNGGEILLRGKDKDIKKVLNLDTELQLPKNSSNSRSQYSLCVVSSKGDCKITTPEGKKEKNQINYSIYCQPKIAKKYLKPNIGKLRLRNIKGRAKISQIARFRKNNTKRKDKDIINDEREYGMRFIRKYMIGSCIYVKMRINNGKPKIYSSKITDIDNNMNIYFAPFVETKKN